MTETKSEEKPSDKIESSLYKETIAPVIEYRNKLNTCQSLGSYNPEIMWTYIEVLSELLSVDVEDMDAWKAMDRKYKHTMPHDFSTMDADEWHDRRKVLREIERKAGVIAAKRTPADGQGQEADVINMLSSSKLRDEFEGNR